MTTVTDHLKLAATEIMRASELVKYEIDDLRKQKTSTERDIAARLSLLLNSVRQLEYNLRHTDDPDMKSKIQSDLMGFERQIADLKAKQRETERDMDNMITQKIRTVSGLESQANSIKP